MEKRSPRVILATIKRQSGVFASKKQAGLGPEVRKDEQPNELMKPSEAIQEKSDEKPQPVLRWRQSLADLQISKKLKQVVGVKRSRDDDDEAPADGERPRKAPAIEPAFWTRYMALRRNRREIEAMVEASAVSHAYDETHGYDKEGGAHEPALAALEMRQSRHSSFSFAGDDYMDFRYHPQLADSKRSSSASPSGPFDFSWAGDEVDDFRCYVKAAHQGWEVQ